MEPGNNHQLIIPDDKGERTFTLPEGKTHLGRARSNEVQLREKSVSRKHCWIERDGDQVVVFDARTRNATGIRRHGKERTKGANGRILRDQDVLFVGRIEIVYRGCSGPNATTTTAQQSTVSPVRGAVPIEEPQAPAVEIPMQEMPPAAQQPPQQWPGQQPVQPYPQQPGQPYQGQPYPGQQPPAQPYPGQQPPLQPYPGQQGQQLPLQPYPGQQGQPGQQPPVQPYPGQPAPPGYGPPEQQAVTFNPAPAPAAEQPKKKIKRRKRKLVAAKPKNMGKTVTTKKTSASPAIPMAIVAAVLVVMLVIVSVISKNISDDNSAERLAIREKQSASERDEDRNNRREATLNSKIAELQRMLTALEKSNQPQAGRPVAAGNAVAEPAGSSSEIAEASSPSEERVLPSSGGGKNIAATRALIASLIKERDDLQKEYGGLNGGTDTSKIEASIARRTAVMNRNGNRILNVEDDEDTRKTAVARIPQKVELSKKDYSALIDRLKETVGNYGLPIANPADLEPDLTELLRATGNDGARGLVAVYRYSSDLTAKMEKTTAFLKRRVEALMANAYKINKDKASYKSGGGVYGSRHNHYLEQLQRLLELSEKKIDIKRDQKRRLAAFQNALGTGFGQLTSVESTKHLTSVYSRSKDTDMQRKMVGAFSKGNALQAVPVLIKSLSSRDRELKGLVKSALASITGINLGDNKKIWDAWWKENGDSATN